MTNGTAEVSVGIPVGADGRARPPSTPLSVKLQIPLIFYAVRNVWQEAVVILEEEPR